MRPSGADATAESISSIFPVRKKFLELINYDSFETDKGNLKYASVEGYQEKSTGISLTTDKTFYFNVTPRQYTLKVEGVQKADGSTETRTYQALYGEEFDLENLQFTGANDPKTNTYSSFQGLTDQNGEAVISVTADLVYAQGDGNNTVLKANYLDNTVTATYNFIGLGNDVEPVQVKFKKGSIPLLTAWATMCGSMEATRILDIQSIRSPRLRSPLLPIRLFARL